MKPPIHSSKHHVQFPITQVVTGTINNVVLAQGVESSTANLATEVSEGSLIKAIFIELWLQNEGTLSEQITTLEKSPLFSAGCTFAQQAALFSYSNKKNILFTSQGLTPNDGVSGPINILRQWIKIPKGKQRFGLGDQLNLNISNVSSNDLVRCGFALYKEYS